jgi:hypothetical protein
MIPAAAAATDPLDGIDWTRPYHHPEPDPPSCVNASLFDRLRQLDASHPVDARRYRAITSAALRSQDAARLAGWPTYHLPVATSLDTREQVGRQVSRKRLDPGVRARQRDRYKRAGADALDTFARKHLRRDPRAGLWRPAWLDHRHGCHSGRCFGCARIPIPAGPRHERRRLHARRDPLLGHSISVPEWLLDRSAAMRSCREVVALVDRVCGGVFVIPQSCCVRTCPDCEAARQTRVVEAYAAAVADLDPDRVRFLTLTVANVPRGELAAGLDHLGAAVARLKHRALWKGGRCRDRARCGMGPDPDRPGWKLPHPPVTAAMTSTEVTYNAAERSWHPHAHLLIESDYLPHDELRGAWAEITGDSRIVWIESVRRHAGQRFAGDVRAALHELLKYAAKPAPAFLEAGDAGTLAELLVALRGRRLTAAAGKLYGRPVDEDPPELDLVLVLPDNPAAEPYRAPRVCPLHGDVADWSIVGYRSRADCRPVEARAGPRRTVLTIPAPA